MPKYGFNDLRMNTLNLYFQGWQKASFYEYCPGQWLLLDKTGYYRTIAAFTGYYKLTSR